MEFDRIEIHGTKRPPHETTLSFHETLTPGWAAEDEQRWNAATALPNRPPPDAQAEEDPR